MYRNMTQKPNCFGAITQPEATLCDGCGAEILCDASSKKSTCWCQSFPHLPFDVAVEEFRCLCPSCLGDRLDRSVQRAIKTDIEKTLVQIADSVSNDEFVEFVDYRIENGNYVFSSWYHLKRGFCCGSGCRNCPFD